MYSFVPAKLAWDEIDGSEGEYLPAKSKKGMIIAPPVNGQPADKRAITATESGVYATIDDGDHWQEMSTTTLGGARPMGEEYVSAVALGPGTLMAGTGYGVFTLPLQPLELTGVAINEPAGGMAPGKTLTTTLSGLGGSRPYWLTYQWYRCSSTSRLPADRADPGRDALQPDIPTEDKNESNTKYRVTVVGRNIVSPTP